MTLLPRTLLTTALACAVPGLASAAAISHWLNPELREVDRERTALTAALASLPPAPERHLTERLGYHSGYSTSPDTVEWVEMDLRRAEKIDAVVLLAAPSNSGGSAPAGYGFPVRFRVEFTDETPDSEPVTIADFTHADFPNPGALPVSLAAHGQSARRIRITATRLFREDNRYLFALGEVMLLQGQRNIAGRLQRADFDGSRRTMGAVPVWGLANLVDGHLVCGPPVGTEPSPAPGYQSRLVNVSREPTPTPRWVQVDLGESLPIEEVRVFPAHPPEFAHRQGFGFPPRCKVEISDDPAFTPAVEVPGFDDGQGRQDQLAVNPGDNAVSYLTRDERARFVRFTALELHNANGQFNLALAELQVWSGGKNVALGQTVSAFDSLEIKGWSKAALVDGFNSRARIVGWPEWLQALSQRRELEQRLAILDGRSSDLLQKLRRAGFYVLAGAIVCGIATLLLSLLRQRRARRLEMEALRQRISQDLHDDIGSNLGSIALATQDALTLTQEPALRRELTEIGDIAQQTLDSMRDIVRLAQTGAYGQGDLTVHLREIADRMLRGVPHIWRPEAGPAFNRLPMHLRRDLVLMFKEALHNVVRHAQATEAEIVLAQQNGSLHLTVRDNGRGFDPAAPHSGGIGLANLQRRVAKHGGTVQLASAPAHGTTLTLTLPHHG
jgi:signal transduction histidine kinase